MVHLTSNGARAYTTKYSIYIFFFKKKHIADLLVAMHWNDAATPCMHETQ